MTFWARLRRAFGNQVHATPITCTSVASFLPGDRVLVGSDPRRVWSIDPRAHVLYVW